MDNESERDGSAPLLTHPAFAWMSSSIKNLAAALAKAQGEMKPAAKSGRNPHFNSNFADLSDIWAAAREPLSKNGLAVTQVPRTGQNGSVRLVTILLHNSGEWISGEYPINPTKNDPQGLGSAMTYGRRYSLSPICGVVVEDDDGNSASEAEKEKNKKNPPRKVPSQENPDEDPIAGLRASLFACGAEFGYDDAAIKALTVKLFPQIKSRKELNAGQINTLKDLMRKEPKK